MTGEEEFSSALHGAAYYGDIEAVRALLADGEPPDARDSSGYTPLLWACLRALFTDMVPVISALIEAGADPDAVNGPGDANCLILAAQSSSAEAVAALLAHGADVNATANGVSALMQAAGGGEEEIVALLVRAGADVGYTCCSYTAADYARSQGHDGLGALLDRLARRQAAKLWPSGVDARA